MAAGSKGRRRERTTGRAVLPEPISGPDLQRIREACAAWMARWEAGGNPIAFYTCTRCAGAIKIPRPTEATANERGCWDSLRSCPQCGGINFVRVWPDGRVENVVI